MPRLKFNQEILKQANPQSSPASSNMAIPSYLHRNPLVQWVVSRRMELVISFIGNVGDKKLLDYGCGTGILFLQLPKGRARYIGVDLDLSTARRVLAGHGRRDVELILAADWMEEVKDKSLDVIVALEVLEHVDDLQDIAELFYLKLKPTGRIIVSGPTENFFYRFCRKVAGFSGGYHLRGIDDILVELKKVGFMLVQKKDLPLPGPLALFKIFCLETTF